MIKFTIGLILVCLLAACGTTETVKIGFIGPLTGTGALYGTSELNAAQLALDDINAQGGINGKKVELIVEDGKCEGAASATAAQKLIQVDNVKYILGGHCSTESLSIVPITEANKVFLMAGATGTDKFTKAGKYAFRTFPSATTLYGKLAEVAR
ncbi:MAG TPA: ABC transporter substrate-binding protein, partial [Candidatus Nanoarchaeia archaeon]|nr:ABC transporter substrate-binding protein [Candidatus Nanoarchaeia archaeon]